MIDQEELAQSIRDEIERTKSKAHVLGFHRRGLDYHRTVGEISGMHRILRMVDHNAHEVKVTLHDQG